MMPTSLPSAFMGTRSHISEQKARALGIRGFAMKPLVRKEIAALIRKVLDRVDV